MKEFTLKYDCLLFQAGHKRLPGTNLLLARWNSRKISIAQKAGEEMIEQYCSQCPVRALCMPTPTFHYFVEKGFILPKSIKTGAVSFGLPISATKSSE